MTARPIALAFALSFAYARAYNPALSRCPSIAECHLANRAPCTDPVQGYCGPCLRGFVRLDDENVCIKADASDKDLRSDGREKSSNTDEVRSSSCPGYQVCADSYRQPCTSTSGGRCGGCLPEYIDVEGVCISEADATALLHFIETDVARRRQQPSATVGNTGSESAAKTLHEAAKDSASMAINRQAPVVAEVPSPVPSVGGLRAENPSVPLTPALHVNGSTNLPPAVGAAASPGIAIGSGVAAAAQVHPERPSAAHDLSQLASIAIILGAAVLAVAAITAAGIYWYRFARARKRDSTCVTKRYSSTSSSSGGTSADEHWHRGAPKGGSSSATVGSAVLSPSGGFDKKLAQSALMYHFEHSKQQIVTRQKAIASKDVAGGESGSDADDDEAEAVRTTEQGDYTVYECPGLAPTSEMEVNNPLFDSTAVRKSASLDSNSNSSVVSPAEEHEK